MRTCLKRRRPEASPAPPRDLHGRQCHERTSSTVPIRRKPVVDFRQQVWLAEVWKGWIRGRAGLGRVVRRGPAPVFDRLGVAFDTACGGASVVGGGPAHDGRRAVGGKAAAKGPVICSKRRLVPGGAKSHAAQNGKRAFAKWQLQTGAGCVKAGAIKSSNQEAKQP